MSFTGEGALVQFRRSRTAGLLAIGVLALALMLPVSMIRGLIFERQHRSDEAAAEVGSKWGRDQTLTGPVLALPYVYRWQEQTNDGRVVEKSATRTALILPDRLEIRGDLATEARSRGIFEVPVYAVDLELSGEFKAEDFRSLGVPDSDIYWDAAELVIGISDVRAIQSQPELAWGDQRAEFLPGTGAYEFRVGSSIGAPGARPPQQATAGSPGSGIRAPVRAAPGDASTAFRFSLPLNGSSALSFVPFGRHTLVQLRGNTGEASFQGNWLPTDRSLDAKTFSASWSIPYLGRGYPQVFDSGSTPDSAVDASRFGVTLISTLDAYRMAERSVKYAFLFIVLTFTAVWLMEVLAGVRVHAIQYLLLGAALCLFYLLELSLAEHIGFPLAYVTASVAVVGMIGAYGFSILKTLQRALSVTAGVAALYAYLYVLLANEDYALLLGSLGLFAVLGLVMYATRRVDWYVTETTQQPAASGPR